MTDSVPSSRQGSDGGVRLTPKAVIAIAISVASLIFVFSNTGEIPLRFLWIEITAPGWVMLLALFVAGFATGFFIGRNRYKQR